MPGERLRTRAVQAAGGEEERRGQPGCGSTGALLPQAAPWLGGQVAEGLGKAPSPRLGAPGPRRRLWPQGVAPQHGRSPPSCPAPPGSPARSPCASSPPLPAAVRAHAASPGTCLASPPSLPLQLDCSQLLPFPLGSPAPLPRACPPPLPGAPALPGPPSQRRVLGGRGASLGGAGVAP